MGDNSGNRNKDSYSWTGLGEGYTATPSYMNAGATYAGTTGRTSAYGGSPYSKPQGTAGQGSLGGIGQYENRDPYGRVPSGQLPTIPITGFEWTGDWVGDGNNAYRRFYSKGAVLPGYSGGEWAITRDGRIVRLNDTRPEPGQSGAGWEFMDMTDWVQAGLYNGGPRANIGGTHGYSNGLDVWNQLWSWAGITPRGGTGGGGGGTVTPGITPDFEAYLRSLGDQFTQAQNTLSGVSNNYLAQYNALLPKLDQFVNEFRGLASSAGTDYGNLLNQLQSSYGTTTAEFNKQIAVRQAAQDALNKLSADVINRMDAAQKSVNTGDVQGTTVDYLDKLYGGQKASAVYQAQAGLEALRKNVYSNMAQRGFMSASAMGTLMSQATRDAQAAIRSQLANIDAQKAAALVEAPYKQFEVARNMLSGVETQKGVEQAARDFLLGSTGQLYSAMFNNAQQAANILNSKYTQQYSGLSNAANTAVQPTLLAGQQYANYRDTMKSYLDALTQANISKYNADINEKIAKLNAAIQQQQIDESSGTDWSGLIGGMIGNLFG